MQKYKDVAERDGKLNEFYTTFGGKENAEDILNRLRNNPQSLSISSIKPLFQNAGKKPLFQKAQIELARQDLQK